MSKIKCLECDTILESKYRHEFKSCTCPNQTYVDGGNDYLRLGGKHLSKIGFWDEKEQKFTTIKINDKQNDKQDDEQLTLF